MMESKSAVLALGALAQETRLAIFRLLVEHGREGLPAGQIAARLGVPTATLSFHLTQLSHAGLVVSQRASRLIIYSVNVERMNDLLQFLTEDCCGGRPDLCLPNSGALAPSSCAGGATSCPPKIQRRSRTPR